MKHNNKSELIMLIFNIPIINHRNFNCTLNNLHDLDIKMFI